MEDIMSVESISEQILFPFQGLQTFVKRAKDQESEKIVCDSYEDILDKLLDDLRR